LTEYDLKEYLGEKPLLINQANLPELYDLALTGLASLVEVANILIIPATIVGLILRRFFTSLLLASLLWLPARLGKLINTWSESWRFTLVLLVVVEIIYWLSILLYPNLTFSVYSASFWILSLFILLSLNSQAKSEWPAETIDSASQK
jgi:hypothetical protein